ncbi:MAG: response regulator transcription factor [Geminicoccaceae bacterium]
MAQEPRILIVDDEDDIRDGLVEYLDRHGFAARAAADGPAMRDVWAAWKPDLVVLDVVMPGEDGLSLARWIRSRGTTGIVMLTTVSAPMDRVIGLELGADDYVCKPADPRELLARIRNVLRRQRPGEPEARPHVRIGRCSFDPVAGRLYAADGSVELLSVMEIDLLKAFAAHPNEILSRERLIALAHHQAGDPGDRSIDVRIVRLRRKLEPDPAQPSVIRTVRGAGYVFDDGSGG